MQNLTSRSSYRWKGPPEERGDTAKLKFGNAAPSAGSYIYANFNRLLCPQQILGPCTCGGSRSDSENGILIGSDPLRFLVRVRDFVPRSRLSIPSTQSSKRTQKCRRPRISLRAWGHVPPKKPLACGRMSPYRNKLFHEHCRSHDPRVLDHLSSTRTLQ